MNRAWHSWVEFAQAAADFQARLVLVVFYFSVLIPFGLLAKLFAGDPLSLRISSAISHWNKRREWLRTLSDARSQF